MDALSKDFKIKIYEKEAKKFKEQLKKDVIFFQNSSIIDYSLLIGIHKKEKVPTKEFLAIRKTIINFTSFENKHVYH